MQHVAEARDLGPLTVKGRSEPVHAYELAGLRAVVGVPVVLYDERFTTDLARQTPSAAPEDALAAAHLLSSYLAWASAATA